MHEDNRNLLIGVGALVALVIGAATCADRGDARRETEARASGRRAAEKALADEQSRAREAAAKRADFQRRRPEIVQTVRGYMNKGEWRLAFQELEPWSVQVGDDQELQTMANRVMAEVGKIEAREDAIAAAELRKAKRREGVRIGMSQHDVLDSQWGKPERINQSAGRWGVHEQWVYPSGNYLYFENGKLTSIQTSR